MKVASYDDGLEFRFGNLPPIWIHFGLPLLAIFITAPLWGGFHPKWMAVAAIVIFGIILSLLAHELAHALAARGYGLTPVIIRLHAGGGEALWEGESWTRHQERLITLAGPATNLVIGIVCLLAFMLLFPAPAQPFAPDSGGEWIRPPLPSAIPATLYALKWLGWLNLIWAGVNLLPAFPLDGGHLFYDIIEQRYGQRRALFWTGLLGLIFAVLAKIMFVAGILAGMVIWSPPYVSPNWQAIKSSRRDTATIINLHKPL